MSSTVIGTSSSGTNRREQWLYDQVPLIDKVNSPARQAQRDRRPDRARRDDKLGSDARATLAQMLLDRCQRALPLARVRACWRRTAGTRFPIAPHARSTQLL